MSYLSKNTILKAYQLLSSIDSDKSQGLTQKVSALKYGTALDRYVKNYGKNCDLKDTGNKTVFTEYVGDVVKINDEICTKDFYTNIAPNGRDYDCGSNFFSQSSVKDSKNNTEVTYDYPKRSGWKPMMNVKNQELLYDAEILKSGIAFYLASSKTKLAYAIWLARFLPIDSNDIEGIKITLSDVYSAVLVEALLQINYSKIDTSYITFEAEKAEINDEDIKSLYDANTLVEENENKTDDGMFEYEELKIGDKSENGKLVIVDKDRLCYLVKSNNYGAEGTRTISKEILSEFVNYLKEHPNTNADQARSALSGNSRVDKFEYGYASTILVLAKMILNGKRKPKKIDQPLQQIFYGAPGTGKSHKIKEDERVKTADGKQLVFRTTFHPDSDYSTFVGAYKPTMKPVADRYKAVAGKDEEITYSFVAQTFLQAYVAAWNNIDEHVFLVIEEINRGNCAQIFGDLFQLLDRDENGFSEYPIIADKDLKKYLNGKDEEGEDVLTNKKGIENGKLCLPSNLHIWATMNTSDQSLFPIDSAFKRRWEWKYMPIANERKGWEIKIDVNKYDWWEFLEIINKKIEETTYSEDKKLGYFFCKAQNGVIDDKKFVGKVLFYLWNDVFKDTDLADSLFTDEDGKKSFDKFYIPLGEGETKVDTARVIAFMEKLEIEPKSEGEIEEEELEEEEDGGVLYVIDGDTFKRKSYAGKEIMMQYLKKHPELTFQEIKEAFPDSMLGRITYGGVIAAEGADLGSYIRYYSPEQFTSSDGVNFRIFKQWTKVNMQNIIDFGNTHGIDVEVKER